MKNVHDKSYFQRTFAELDKNREKMERKRINFLKNHVILSENVKILDMGCGLGFFLNICDQLNMQTYGVDAADYALEMAKKITKAKLSKVDLSKDRLPFPDNFFDVVTSFDVIEHVERPEHYLSEMQRVLCQKGLAIIITPDGQSKFDQESTHINLRSSEEWMKELKKNNFEIIECKENHAHIKRMVPLRRFVILNLLNMRLCDLFGRYVKEVVIIFKKI
ncbi:MAG: class I SAM-dependent methyltransferase [bacterium]